MRPTQFGIGAPLRRKEDPALLTGKGRYLADISPANAAHAYILRAPVAHAEFSLGGLEEARAADGVVDIITGEDIAGYGVLPVVGMFPNADGSTPTVPPYPLLAIDRIRHVGEALAVVVADTYEQAREAAELIEMDLNDLPVVVRPADALKEDAPLLWPELGTNLAVDAAHGDREATDAAFEKAAKVVRLELENNRVICNFMETRGAIGEYDPESGRYTLTVSSQGAHLIQPIVSEKLLGIPKDRLRVVTPDVGGGFGTKFFTYREYGLVLVAGERAGRPVKWIADRSEHFLADYHGRDQTSVAELALDKDGHFLGIRIDTYFNVGCHIGQMALFCACNGAAMAAGVYSTPAMHIRVRGAYTNTIPVDAYRGAGRPEAAYLIERLVDKAALETGLAPDEIRRRNFIQPEQMPFTTATKRTYDTGDFAQHMAVAMEKSDWAGFEARVAANADEGKLRGIGMSTYIEACSGGGSEHATVELDTRGGATVYVGTQSQGQGHATAYAQLVSQQLGIDPDNITLVQGDTDRIVRGAGTGGSRSIPVGGTSVTKASEKLADKVKKKAADRLEASPDDLELSQGEVRIAGTDRAVPLAEIIAEMPEDERRDQEDWQPPAPTFPNGTHVVEVEVDPDTGVIDIVNYTVVDDFGVTLNPMLLEGQIHGGVGQGVGQAIFEHTVYDEETGQLLSASLMDYALPRADYFSNFSFETRNVPSTTNAMGMKGAGEAGSIGSCPALVNAVCNALHRAYGVTHIDMPMTPQRVWQTIQAAKG